MHNYVFEYLRNLFYRKAHIPSAVASTIELLVNLDAITIIKMIIKQFGLNYLLKYVVVLSLL
jgi:hypothetical protein